MKKVTVLAVLTLLSAPPIQGQNGSSNRVVKEEDERSLFDVVVRAVPYALSAGALYFCYALQQRVTSLEAQIKKVDKLDGLETRQGSIETKQGVLEQQISSVATVANNSATKADFEALRNQPQPIVVNQSRPESRNTDEPPVVISAQPSPTHATDKKDN